jgi:hypothetical protein
MPTPASLRAQLGALDLDLFTDLGEPGRGHRVVLSGIFGVPA